MDEGNLEPEEPAMRLFVDQLDTLRRQPAQLAAKIAHLVGHVVHSRTPVREELAHGSLVTKRCEQLDPTLADAHRSSLDTLLRNRLAALDLRAEQPSVGVDRLVEVLDGDTEVMDPLRLHAKGCYPSGVLRLGLLGRLFDPLERDDTTNRLTGA